MLNRAAGDPDPGRRYWPSPSMLIAGAALFVALGGSAVAADRLIRTKDIAPSAVTSAKIKNGSVTSAKIRNRSVTSAKIRNRSVTSAKIRNRSVTLADLQPKTLTSLRGANGLSGTNGANGATGAAGANGLSGTNGSDGADGADGTNGTNGSDGADGVLGPLSNTAGLTALPTSAPPTTVVSLTVPAGNYVVFAKTQLSHTGAGDTIDCTLRAGTTTIDQGSMKTLPALAAIPVSFQAVTTTSPTQLSLQCSVAVADGSANFSSLIALPVA